MPNIIIITHYIYIYLYILYTGIYIYIIYTVQYMHSIWCEASEHILKLLMIWKVLYSYSTWQAVCLLIFCQTKFALMTSNQKMVMNLTKHLNNPFPPGPNQPFYYVFNGRGFYLPWPLGEPHGGKVYM